MRNKPPYVCNGCADLCRCTLKKKVYNAHDAHTAFSKKISEARSGILSNEKELSRLDALISPLIRKGNSIHQIYINHADELMCSEKTVYNYVDACLFEDIAEALKAKGLDMGKGKVVIPEPIKELGDFEVLVNLEHGLEANIGVIVEAE
jgi:hypothetical protein